MLKLKPYWFLTICLLILWQTPSVKAFTFNPNNIISDFELYNKDSMSRTGIQKFLEKQQSVLTNFVTTVKGVAKKASEVIYETAQTYGINPQFIISRLDTEQGLIRKKSFSSPAKKERALDFAVGYGVCDSCTKAQIQKYKGFAKQIDYLASVQKVYAATPAKFNFKVGQSSTTLDGKEVTPENQATANQYIYTPWHGDNKIGGNRLFARIWQQYFGNNNYPDGTVVIGPRKKYWLMRNGMRYLYTNPNIFLSDHQPSDAIKIPTDEFNKITAGGEIKFPNYSLLQVSDLVTYLIVDNKKHFIKDKETFRKLGFNPEEVIKVTLDDITSYDSGPAISKDTLFPQGQLVINSQTKQLYWAQNGKKHPVNPTIKRINYPQTEPLTQTGLQLQSLSLASPKKLKDGTFIKGPNQRLFVISKGYKLEIANQNLFFKLYGAETWKKIIKVDQALLNLHPNGSQIKAPEPTITATKPTSKSKKTTKIRKPWLSNWAGRNQTTYQDGQYQELAITFRNLGANNWTPDNVRLKINDDQEKPLKITKQQDQYLILGDTLVKTKALARFSAPIKLAVGEHQLNLELEQISTGKKIPGSWLSIKVKSIATPYAAQIISHNLPLKIERNQAPLPVEITIKNTGHQPWTRKRTALQFLAANDLNSPFYDPNDWLDQKTAAVALKPRQQLIQPGQTTTFNFTLKPPPLKSGSYNSKIQLYLTNNQQFILINQARSYPLTLELE